MSGGGTCMRGENVLQLIKYHYEKNDEKFDNTVQEIINEEMKKGNKNLSEKILKTQQSIKIQHNKGHLQTTKQNLFSYGPSSGLTLRENNKLITPKDKSTQNDLFDLVYPGNREKSEIVLSESVNNKIEGLVKEFNNREMLKRLNLDVENRLLLCGPPGCGKTTTAYLISSLLNLPLAYVRLDSLVTSLLGQTGTNIRKIFEAVSDMEIILFIDEFDAIAKKRDDNHELGELKRVVNTLLQNIDLLPDNVFLIAATNHQDLLDKAVWRRFNTVLYLDFPEEGLRTQYIQNTLHKFENKIKIDVDLKKFSRLCKGLSYAAIEEILIKAIKNCIIHERKNVLKTRDVTEILLNTIFLYNKGNNLDIQKLRELRENGLSLRDLSEMTSIPRSTLSDWINK